MALKTPELISIWLGNYNILCVSLGFLRGAEMRLPFLLLICVLCFMNFSQLAVKGENRRPNDVLNIILTFLLQRFLFAGGLGLSVVGIGGGWLLQWFPAVRKL